MPIDPTACPGINRFVTEEMTKRKVSGESIDLGSDVDTAYMAPSTTRGILQVLRKKSKTTEIRDIDIDTDGPGPHYIICHLKKSDSAAHEGDGNATPLKPAMSTLSLLCDMGDHWCKAHYNVSFSWLKRPIN